MAEEAKKKPDAPAPAASAHAERSAGREQAKPAAAEGSGSLFTRTPVLLGGVMLLQALVIVAGFKFFAGGSPKQAGGAELAVEEGQATGHDAEAGHGTSAAKVDKKKSVEIQVLDFRAPNKQSGRTFLYDVTIFVVTKAEFEKQVKETIAAREALIKDRVRTIIAQSDPEKLGGGSEPGLETLRRQVKYQLDEIIGEGMIEEVLVPRCIPFRTDF